MIRHLSSSMLTLHLFNQQKTHTAVNSHTTRNQLKASKSYPSLTSPPVHQRTIDEFNRTHSIHLYFSDYFSLISDDTISDEEKDRAYNALIKAIINQYENAQTQKDLVPLAICARYYSVKIVTDITELNSLLESKTFIEYGLSNSQPHYLKAIYYLTVAIARDTQTDADDTLLDLWQKCVTLTLDTVISQQTPSSESLHNLGEIQALTTQVIADSEPKITQNAEWFTKLKKQSTSLEMITASANTEQKNRRTTRSRRTRRSCETF
ncbi:hypothetical protein GCM10023116_25420 [Kistimonas scapharcae]|uniref:Uncharacterized protein n=1 Tax=Kistimonas scapharcae TaxID=1036133 RepID=A0ABP8V2M4_9GAMM